jgi:hypothetical protein
MGVREGVDGPAARRYVRPVRFTVLVVRLHGFRHGHTIQIGNPFLFSSLFLGVEDHDLADAKTEEKQKQKRPD